MIMCRGCCKDFPDDDVFVCNCENAEPYCANCSCPVCNHNGTGEVEMIHDPAIVMERNASAGEVPDVRFSRTSEPLSNSEQLAKPEMPDGIRIKRLDSGYLRVVDSEPEDWNYLSTDKVMELVRLHEDFRDLLLKYRFTPGVPDELNAKAEEIDNLQSALFPEGVEDKEDK
jgi:hypothetical protein